MRHCADRTAGLFYAWTICCPCWSLLLYSFQYLLFCITVQNSVCKQTVVPDLIKNTLQSAFIDFNGIFANFRPQDSFVPASLVSRIGYFFRHLDCFAWNRKTLLCMHHLFLTVIISLHTQTVLHGTAGLFGTCITCFSQWLFIYTLRPFCMEPQDSYVCRYTTYVHTFSLGPCS
jgi:hypothetical protein